MAKRGKKPKDITGQKFGKLTAIKPVGQTKHCTYIWHFECECGGIRDINTGSLSTMVKKFPRQLHCGCEKGLKRHYMKDITGERIGITTAIKRLERQDKSGYYFWEFKCDCGKIIEATINNLYTKRDSVRPFSCGCNIRGNKNIGGERFGRLVAIKRISDKFELSGAVRWECHCDCGNKHTARTLDLLNGTVQSCGCILRAKFIGDLDKRNAIKICRQYCGLDGEPDKTLQEIADMEGISRERIRQIVKKTLTLLLAG